MRYLQISTVVSYTSVGRIIRQNYDDKKAQGWDCLIAYGRGDSVEGYNTIKIGPELDCKMHGIATRLFDKHGYGSKHATRKFLKEMDEYNPNVIHLHNIHGYYINYELLFKWLKAHPERRVIWTLHDCWAITGHCAYFTAAKCFKWKTQCVHCSQKKRYPSSFLFSNTQENYRRKKEAFTGVKGMTLIVPSYWLKSIVQESYLREYKIEVIHNKIDTNIFKPTSSNFREIYGLMDKKVILGVANVWEERKGLDDFIRLASMLDKQFAIVLIGLNKKQIKQIKKIPNVTVSVMQKYNSQITIYDDMACGEIVTNVDRVAIHQGIDNLYYYITKMYGKIIYEETAAQFICMEKTDSARELAALYTMADVFVNPTYEDNYPTVNLEAIACGTKVITYDVGGCKETLEKF